MWGYVVYAVILIAGYFIAKANAPKPQDAQPMKFENIDFPQAEEGTAQAVIFGDCWSGDWMVLAVGNYHVTAIRK